MIKTNHYEEDEFLSELSELDKAQLRTNIVSMIDEYSEELKHLYGGLASSFDGTDDVCKLSLTVIRWSFHEVDDKLIFTKDFIERFQEKLNRLLNKYIVFYKLQKPNKLKVKIKQLYQIVVNNIKKLIFKFFLCKNNVVNILSIDELCFYHLVSLPNNISTIYYKTSKLNIDHKCNIFDVNIYKIDEAIRTNDRLDYIKLNKQFSRLNLRLFNTSTKYGLNNNSNYIDLRKYYNRNDYHPNINDIVDFIKNKAKKGSDIYVVLPIFLETNSVFLNSNYHGYMQVYFEYFYFYKRIITELGKLIGSYKLNIVISNSMNYKDYLWWNVTVKEHLNDYSRDDFAIGVVLDEFSMVYDIEKYHCTDFVLIDLDELSYNLDENTYGLSLNTFKKELEIHMRELHDFLKYSKIRHPIKAENLKDESVMEKLIIMGFNEFIYSNVVKKNLENVINNYGSRRGKYQKDDETKKLVTA